MSETPKNISSEELEQLLASEPQPDADRLREAWDAAGSIVADRFPEASQVDAVWNQIDSQIKRRQGDRTATPPRARVYSLKRMIMSAAAVIILLAAGLGYLTRSDNYSAPLGERTTVQLRDGSTVELNAGSSLSYRKSLTGNRIVSLNGEAYFDVLNLSDQKVESGSSSFVVNTFNGVLTVLGTEFNVRAWEGSPENRTAVSLYTGSLRVSNRSYPESGVLMQPGETKYVLSSEASPTPAEYLSNDDAIAWRSGDLIFKESYLEVALDDVERRFDIQIELSATTHRQRMVSVAFRAPDSAESVINDLAQALGLNYRPRSTGFEIYASEIP